MKQGTRARQWMSAALLLTLLVFGLKTQPVYALRTAPSRLPSTLHSTPHRSLHRSLPPDERRVVSGLDWLNGYGVGVYYAASPDDEYPRNEDGTIQYECVELVVRLYARSGYTTSWPVKYAYEIADLAGKPGFTDWMFTANGGTKAPRVGDIVVWPPEYGDGLGHVSVVNRVDVTGGTVQVVHQNVWRGSQPIPISEMSLQQDRRRGFMLLGRDGGVPLGWIHSTLMEAWLRQQPSFEPAENASNHTSHFRQ